MSLLGGGTRQEPPRKPTLAEIYANMPTQRTFKVKRTRLDYDGEGDILETLDISAHEVDTDAVGSLIFYHYVVDEVAVMVYRQVKRAFRDWLEYEETTVQPKSSALVLQ